MLKTDMRNSQRMGVSVSGGGRTVPPGRHSCLLLRVQVAGGQLSHVPTDPTPGARGQVRGILCKVPQALPRGRL